MLGDDIATQSCIGQIYTLQMKFHYPPPPTTPVNLPGNCSCNNNKSEGGCVVASWSGRKKGVSWVFLVSEVSFLVCRCGTFLMES